MLPTELAHLRLQVDDLERRAEDAAGDPLELRRLRLEAIALERSLAAVDADLQQQMADIKTARNRLKRLRARG